uniref:Pentraxin family member n=1 Tax=Laticauda laticaudata TaxID=8630 RepID=A0A8C5S2K6_LATLA
SVGMKIHPFMVFSLSSSGLDGKLTVCLRFFTDLTRSFSLFSAASQDHDNEILLSQNPNSFKRCVGGDCAVFPLPIFLERSPFHWESVCTTWDSASGMVHLWLDGEALAEERGNEGYEVKADLVVMLGQDQDSDGGILNVKQSLVGEIAEVYFWDKVLPSVELNNFQAPMTPRPLLDWTSLKFEIRGYVLTAPVRSRLSRRRRRDLLEKFSWQA